MSTIKDVAKMAGVSISTVSRVVNGNSSVDKEMTKKVENAVKILGYKPNLTARTLVKNSSNIIGIVIPSVTIPYFVELLKAVEKKSRMLGYSIIVSNTEGKKDIENDAIKMLKRRNVDGIFLIPTSNKIDYLLDIPFILVSQYFKGVDSVSVNHEKGAALITEHLLEEGYKNIAYIGNYDDDKFLGFKETLDKNGIKFNDENFIQETPWLDYFNDNEIEKYIKTMGNKNINAIFSHNDVAAFKVIRILKKYGYRIPEDIAVAGFDNSFLSKISDPKITSIEQPIYEIIEIAFEKILEKIKNKNKDNSVENILLDPKLIIEESTHKK